MTLVVDGTVAVAASLGADGFAILDEEHLVAPPLMWSEARSALHELLWRGEIVPEDADHARRRLERAPVERIDHEGLGDEVWRLADEFGWAKTYYAEYVGLARLLGCRLVTLDARLHRATVRLGIVVAPTEL